MRFLKEPLLHFLLIGIAVFGLYAWLDDRPAAEVPGQIVVTTADAARLAEQFQAVWRRPPTVDELASLLDDFVREEIYVREAQALGLDRDDAVIRQRLRQKMTFLTESAVQALEPTDAELEAHLDAHRERFTQVPRLAFRQVFLGEAPAADEVRELTAALTDGVDPSGLGVPTLLPQEMPLAAPATVDGTFGPGFFARVATLPEGVWSGPVESAFGSHLIHLDRLIEGALPPFEAVREKVLLDWRSDQAAALSEQAFERMRAGYAVSKPDAAALGELLP